MPAAPYDIAKQELLEAALMHVAFDGWSDATFKAAVRDSGMDIGLAKSVCPRGAIDLAIAFHKRGDEAMIAAVKAADLTEMKFRQKVAFALRTRFELIMDKEAVQRGTTLFALPHLAADGAKLIWGTADAIWTVLGDTSEDVNWYTKRATLSGVYASTVLYWLGDDSTDTQATWDFIDRRIENVMQFEKVKAQMNSNPALSKLMAGPNWLMSQIKAPTQFAPPTDLPGMWRGDQS
ncbi:COQ9 family protein [Nereida ignava]|uniref:RpsU-divergently transcribed protein n=1 Tax=Nereida ignava TaxID=282199 RepID=A0A0U1NL51_9RHOB|nr:COQ9 family protein [Nereida ignava]CRK75456.1 rpsU-divergently transcribed protein [Nereida ignava]SFJ52606.1 ubiquinone biosynthesis protein COQ9 [Nereida ignava DSM 16309]